MGIGIDVNASTIREQLANPLIDRVEKELIPELKGAYQDGLDLTAAKIGGAAKDAIAEADGDLTNRLVQVAAMMKDLVAGLEAIVDRFDGLTITVAMKPKG